MHHAPATPKPTKKLHILHQRNVWKSPGVNESCSPAENSMITTSNPEQKSCIVGKAVGQSINDRFRQTDPEITARDCRLAHYRANLIQTVPWYFGVYVKEPQDVAACFANAGIHLNRPAAFAAPDELIAESCRELISTVGAFTVGHNDLGCGRPLPQMGEKRLYQRRLIKNRNNN